MELKLPLTVGDELRDHDIIDATGKTVARPAHGDLEIAKAIALAINEGEFLKNLVRKLAAIVHDEYDGTDWYTNLLTLADEVAGRGTITQEDI